MGKQCVQVDVRGSVSRHNSAQDRLDDALLEHLGERIADLTREPLYASLDLTITWGEC